MSRPEIDAKTAAAFEDLRRGVAKKMGWDPDNTEMVICRRPKYDWCGLDDPEWCGNCGDCPLCCDVDGDPDINSRPAPSNDFPAEYLHDTEAFDE